MLFNSSLLVYTCVWYLIYNFWMLGTPPLESFKRTNFFIRGHCRALMQSMALIYFIIFNVTDFTQLDTLFFDKDENILL